MSWCFDDEEDSYADAVLESLENAEALVPAIWPLELGNVLLVGERKKRLDAASVARFLALLGGLPITVEQETPERTLNEIFSLARETGLSTYDASYLDLAMRLGLPLATQDAALMKAAKKSGVPLFHPAGSR
ncbi:MAG: type II toxin-antitoxin system VapC family toxin [Nitrospinae bacterium]|nr:type II toxin-antitoxin system VapC family toxin [Nitrospinota bacterium]